MGFPNSFLSCVLVLVGTYTSITITMAIGVVLGINRAQPASGTAPHILPTTAGNSTPYFLQSLVFIFFVEDLSSNISLVLQYLF